MIRVCRRIPREWVRGYFDLCVQSDDHDSGVVLVSQITLPAT